MNLILQGTHLDLSDEIRALVAEKMEDSLRALGDLNRESMQVAVELEHISTRSLYRAEANVSVPGRLIRAEAEAEDVEQAVVKMKHQLTRELRDWYERLIERSRKGAREAKAMLDAEVMGASSDLEEEWSETEVLIEDEAETQAWNPDWDQAEAEEEEDDIEDERDLI